MEGTAQPALCHARGLGLSLPLLPPAVPVPPTAAPQFLALPIGLWQGSYYWQRLWMTVTVSDFGAVRATPPLLWGISENSIGNGK